MTNRTEKLAVLFADICGSTALYENLGDEKAHQLITNCLRQIIEKAIANQGTLVETIGDEILCTFPDAEHAMIAACAMQNTVENDNSKEEHPMHIRIGFHYGDVTTEMGKVYGDTINVAARVASITRAAQIISTMACVETLPTTLRARTHQIMRADVKGKQDQLEIFRVVWEEDEEVLTRIGKPTYRKTEEVINELTLKYNGQTCKINGYNKSTILGRHDTCDLLIKNEFSSRQHARVEFRFGNFVISDNSTNGTSIRFADGRVINLVRDELILHDSGSICLGQLHADNPRDLIEFSIEAVTAPKLGD